ncbi:MAG: NupC/NupG family nucleoside CNT transporter [Thermochromatium sp.]
MDHPDLLTRLQPLCGLLTFLALTWGLSEDRRAVRIRLVLGGLGLQLIMALALFKLPAIKDGVLVFNQLVLAVQTATQAGTELVFGYLGGASAPFETVYPHNSFVLAFRALPLILVISALSALLFHWRILPLIVRAFAWLLSRTLGLGGPLGLAAAANVFLGMTEAPLLIRPYVSDLSRSALFGLMTCGMATIAGTVMVLYASLIGPVVPDAMAHILTASLINAPSALVIAGMLIPEPAGSRPTTLEPRIQGHAHSAMDAITRGALEAIPLWLNIIAMLIVMVALVSLLNQALTLLPEVAGEPLTAQWLLGHLMAPVVWLIGIPWSEAQAAGALMGVKTILNELVAYLQLAALPPEALSERSRIILTYALCGFANLGSLGILIGGLGALAPERRPEIVTLGFKSVLAGTLANLMTGALVAILL